MTRATGEILLLESFLLFDTRQMIWHILWATIMIEVLGLLASAAMVPVKRPKVTIAADGHPCRFHQRPAQPFVALAQEPAV